LASSGVLTNIRWSIVNQLGGKIDVKSELNKGTDVTVTLDVLPIEKSPVTDRKATDIVLPDAELLLNRIREQAKGRSVNIIKRDTAFAAKHTDLAWQLAERYLTKWFGFDCTSSTADIVVTNDYQVYEQNPSQRTLVVEEELVHPLRREGNGLMIMSNPLGPFKLARALLALLDQDQSRLEEYPSPTVTHDIPDRPALLKHLQSSTSTTSKNSSQSSISPQRQDSRKENENTTKIATSAADMVLRLPDRSIKHSKQASTSSLERGSLTPSIEILPLPIVPQAIPLPSSPPKSPQLSPINTGTASKMGTGRPKTRPTSTSDIQKRSLRVLAVDDNDLNLQLLYRYLQKRKQDVIETARDGVQAVNKVKSNESFDIIFMDISMPNMDGFEATRQIRSHERSQLQTSNEGTAKMSEAEALSPANNEDITGTVQDIDGVVQTNAGNVRRVGHTKAFVVALTGLASRRDRDEAQQSGFDGFLTKPISFKRIGELLDRLSWEK
jgi:CheY-like chemotaxis protein